MRKKIAAFVFAFVLIATWLCPSVAFAEDELQWQDFNGKKIGVLTGTPLEAVGEEFFPDSELLYFNSYPDCSAALLSGTIAAYLADEPSAKMTHFEQPKINYIPERFTENNYAFAFRKNDEESAALCREFNTFLEGIMSDGTIKEIEDTWFGTDESKKTVDMSDLTGENGTLTVAPTSTDMPWSFMKDNKNVGYDIDIVTRFCRENGYALKIMDVDFAGRIPALESGKCDFTTDMNVTPEREEEVLFSNPTADGGVVLVTKSEVLGNDGAYKSFTVLDIKDSFEKTFIREDRYKLFFSGVGITLLITVLSIVFGTALGFAVYMAVRNGNRVANAIADLFSWIIQGLPVVVLLMILYYIIFARTDMGGVVVSIIAFTLVFGAGVLGMLKSATGAVDSGQNEAAYALGYSDRRAFFRIILPQALPHFLPAYKGEVVALLKATAIVGYIAVQDLTKMGDIVRGRTYEAFFPLIAVAVIYFILEGILIFAVSRIEINRDPRRRKKEKILKGVKADD